MLIQSLQITNFRNISCAMLACSAKFNVFYGDNAAGKTSVLEAIYALSTAKSFRCSHHDVVIRHDQAEFTLFSNCYDGFSVIPIGLERNRNGFLRIHLLAETIRSIAEVSQLLPVVFIGSDSHRILTDGPKARRQFLDWGLFYTCPHFYPQWKVFQKILNHRNAALKNRVSREELTMWNVELANAGEVMHQLRQSYVDDFLPVFVGILAVFLEDVPITARYVAGWDAEFSLLDCLNQQLYKEMQVGHTLSGPHRADLLLTVDNLFAEDVLSQGQQKLVSYALHLSQGIYLKMRTQKSPIFLIDDMPSELDTQKQALVVKILADLGVQVFITGIHARDLEQIQSLHLDNKMFHVKHGAVEECLDPVTA